DEEVSPVEPLPPLHDFQLEVYSEMRQMLRGETDNTGLMSLPTGAGKTRVAVEAICDHLVEELQVRTSKNIVLWIAQSEELQMQAWECFRQVWQVPPQRKDAPPIRRGFPVRIVRLWGGRKYDEVEIGDEPTVLIAGIAQLDSWVESRPEFFENFPVRRLMCVVVDEAHKVVTKSQRDVLVALRLRAKHQWRALQNAPPVVGLSATPWRPNEGESAQLKGYFQNRLIRPALLRDRPIAELQRREILAQVVAESLDIDSTHPMNEKQQKRFEQFGELPADYVEELGMEHDRNARILERLKRLRKTAKVLVFACSIAHAEVLAVALNRALGNGSAAVVTGETPRAERAAIIERFKAEGDLRFLCNVNVLTTGFDAPRADTICITRPTTSALLYEQMVGRGLRGPKNGGTRECLVIDVQDRGMPDGIQSYARVLKLWDG
ncbi:MAG TPA: DEAD/DEAH box helicase, partial [Polyangium sp.]|nr:DEAD/DEAH box helicase [Polyangium sp.]